MTDPEVDPAVFWEERYAGADRVWSGRVNAVLAEVAGALAPGAALDLGCGEGGDVIWLAENGWRATGIDISRTAVARARKAAADKGFGDDRAAFLTGDLSDAVPRGPFDLVTASFFQSPVELARETILRRAAELVVPGGHLLVTSHAAPPPWADADPHDHRFRCAAEELAALALDPGQWTAEITEDRDRTASGPGGQAAVLRDAVVLLGRR